ncbi:MAG: hypothetical protein LBJ48_06725 [Coriobacteriales bacterium]|jgi:hypothetical protein|nr:hypothetical protein [Coriobacteriales bacterium]
MATKQEHAPRVGSAWKWHGVFLLTCIVCGLAQGLVFWVLRDFYANDHGQEADVLFTALVFSVLFIAIAFCVVWTLYHTQKPERLSAGKWGALIVLLLAGFILMTLATVVIGVVLAPYSEPIRFSGFM